MAGKLKCPGQLAAVTTGSLVHIVDENTGKQFLVDIDASFSIFHHWSLPWRLALAFWP
jgi:hypothetical protein